jgi:hypothetical protein
MSIKLIYQTEVRGGRLHIFRRKEFLRDIQQFEGRRTEIILQLRIPEPNEQTAISFDENG